MYKASTLSGSDDTQKAKTFLGRYQLQKKIAVGGMAELYLAHVTGVGGFEKQVVVKRILPQLAESEELFRMFLDEARIAATLQHPNVVQIYDSCEEDGEYFMAMEYLDGTDLRTLRKVLADQSMPLPWEHALYIIVNIAAGLHYAHEKRDFSGEPLGIVHRDVTPHNIFLTREGGIKLVDFGIAKAQGRMTETAIGTLKGKLTYMSPEQCKGKPIDRRSDIYSLGVILYELTTGRRLYRGKTEYELINEIVDEEVTKPSSFMEYPSELETIVLRCLQKDREKRYQSARDIQADIENFAREYRLMFSTLSFASFLEPLLGHATKAAEERWKHRKDVMPIRKSSGGRKGPRRSPSVVAAQKVATPKPEPEGMATEQLQPSEKGENELTARVPTEMLARLRLEERESAAKEREDHEDAIPEIREGKSVSANIVRRETASIAQEDQPPASDKSEAAHNDTGPNAGRSSSEESLKESATSQKRKSTELVTPLQELESLHTGDFQLQKPGNTLWILAVLAAIAAAAAVFIFSGSEPSTEPAPVVAPAQGTLSITANRKADVWLFLGRTPILTTISSQQPVHRIRLNHEGYQMLETTLGPSSWKKDLEGNHFVEATLALLPKGKAAKTKATPVSSANGPAPRQLRLDSNPTSAKAWIYVGNTPNLTLEKISTRESIQLRIEVEGSPPLFRSIQPSSFDEEGRFALHLDLPSAPSPQKPPAAKPPAKKRIPTSRPKAAPPKKQSPPIPKQTEPTPSWAR